MKRQGFLLSLTISLIAWLAGALAGAQTDDPFQSRRADPAIRYDSTPTHDPVADLKRRIDAGEVQLTSDGPSGYLRSLLAALNVSPTSQIAVFSKGSLQASRINAE